MEEAEQLVELACRFEGQQDQSSALQAFLKALDSADATDDRKAESSEEELVVYREALDLYIRNIDKDPAFVLSEIRSHYEKIYQDHANWYQLGTFVAIADANDHEFSSFYRKFFLAYQQSPSSFLSLRTRGVLHHKLFERSLGKKREKHRKLAMNYLQEAVRVDIRETGALRLLLFTATKEERQPLLEELVPKIVDEKVTLPRGDITLYVKWLLQGGYIAHAALLLDHVKECYNYSRSIEVAERLIENHKQL